jgi:putative ABC transport system permease protein
MLRHNLLLIYRNFKRFKGTFLINLVGLSTGLSCTLLIYLWVMDELKMDQFHENIDRIYQVMENRVKTGGIWTAESNSAPTAESLKADFPEIEYTAVHGLFNKATLSIGDHNVAGFGRFVGKDYFNILSFELTQGDKHKVLADNNSMAISESMAVRLFGSTDHVLGKTVVMDHDKEFILTGVFKDAPSSSSDKLDYVWSFERFREGKGWINNWGNTNVSTYILLKPGADAAALNAKLADYVQKKTNNEITHRTMFIRKFADRYLRGEYENGMMVGGRITYVKLFSIIAVFIMLIACINFMNLSTAKASRRIKEVGIKKAIGAGRGTLVYRYLGESLLLSFISLLVALLFVDLFLPYFNDITAKQLALRLDAHLLLPSVAITLTTGLLAGSYPALYLSGFNPAAVLKGKLPSSWGELWARKGLVVFQFALSVIFIIAVTVVYKQIEYAQSKALGYQRDGVIYFGREGKLWEPQALETFLTELRDLPGVVHASASNHDMTGHNSGTYGVEWPGKDPNDKTEFEVFTVDYDMIETLGLEMTEGRAFTKDFHPDTARIIFNEAAITYMNNMQQPIGKTVMMWGGKMEIIGVVKNFHYESLHEPLKPVLFRYDPENAGRVMVKLKAGAERETLERLKAFYTRANEGFTLDYKFLDEDYQAQYAAEQRVAVLSRYFAGLAILISCLGLFGLATFTAERRLKEIGIRKVLGSSEFNIVLILSGDFTKIVLTAIAIALPVSYFLTKQWLNSFAFPIALEWWYFAGAGMLALGISWVTVGSQAIKAARVNPTKCLKEQ